MIILEGAATDEVTNDHSPLTVFVVLKAHDDHPMTAGTSPPPIVAVVFADLARCDELEIAVWADVVVAVITLRTVKSRFRRRDRLRADVALGGHREQAERVCSAG